MGNFWCLHCMTSLGELKCGPKYLQMSVSLFQFGSAELAQLYAGLIRSIADLIVISAR